MEKEENKPVCDECGEDMEFKGMFIQDSWAINTAYKYFPEIWKNSKEDLKAMNKKELAQQMFLAGTRIMADEINNVTQESLKGQKEKNL